MPRSISSNRVTIVCYLRITIVSSFLKLSFKWRTLWFFRCLMSDASSKVIYQMNKLFCVPGSNSLYVVSLILLHSRWRCIYLHEGPNNLRRQKIYLNVLMWISLRALWIWLAFIDLGLDAQVEKWFKYPFLESIFFPQTNFHAQFHSGVIFSTQSNTTRFLEDLIS